MLGLVSTGMGYRILVQSPVRDIYLGIYQLPRLAEPGHHLWVDTVRTNLRVVALQLWSTDCVGGR